MAAPKKWIKHKGKLHTTKQLEDLYGVSYNNIRWRLIRGWTIEAAVSSLVRGYTVPDQYQSADDKEALGECTPKQLKVLGL